ncbi:copper resistance protein B [Rhizorhabdus argentea]|uniref:copper resistance protein B n=1 Tax=Rhizorhabdus argentea TaxID=1387174 RepID=UPI0030ED61ED
MKRTLLCGLLLASPAVAQEMDHSQHGMTIPSDPHAGHDMPAPEQPTRTTAPAPSGDHAADRFYPGADMAAARAALLREHGAMTLSQLMVNFAEYRPDQRRDGYAWNAEAWIGGDIDRLVLKSEGEGSKRLDHAEVQALWGHALDPYWNLQLGVRQGIRPRPGRTYAALSIAGLAPYWFEVEASLFLSNRGDVSARIEAWHDMRLTQRLILQPRLEANAALTDDRATGSGSGLSDAKLGLRLRYDISRRFAPYVGIVHERRFGETARFAAASGEGRRQTRAVFGVRGWF